MDISIENNILTNSITKERVIFTTAELLDKEYSIGGRKYSNEDYVNIDFKKSLEKTAKHDYCFPGMITGKIILSENRPSLEGDSIYGLRPEDSHFLFSIWGQPKKSEKLDLDTRILLLNNGTKAWGDLNVPFYTLKPTISENVANFFGGLLNSITFQPLFLPFINRAYSKEDYNAGIKLIPKLVKDAITIEKAIRDEQDSMELISKN